jgi:hypothetical protein
MRDPEQLREDLERMMELERRGAHGNPKREMKAWLDKLAEIDSERRSYIKLAARGTITDLELDEGLGELEETRATAERELAALRNQQEVLEALELDRVVLLEHYAAIAPEALDSLIPTPALQDVANNRDRSAGHHLRGQWRLRGGTIG